MIAVENLTKRFRRGRTDVRALDDISFEIPAGKLALFRGPSGSGKTTLINILAGLTQPTSGRVEVAGLAIQGMTDAHLARMRARQVAVVFQMFHLVPYLSAFENVLLPTLATNVPACREKARALMESLGVGERAGHFPSELSAGERQRCALARALMADPAVILADEPTGNLDEESAGRVLAMLQRRRDEGTTVLLVSHQSVEAAKPDLEFELRSGKLGA